jgi:hypothetical protein
MAHGESSVMTSLQQLMVQEEERRKEQVYRAHRLKQEQERLLFEEQARRAEEAQKRAESAAQSLLESESRSRAEAVRLEGERSAYLERVRANLELEAKLAVMKSEQQAELERLSILRDANVRRLEGQRGLFVALLSTVLLGSLGVYFLILRPASVREATERHELSRTFEERRLGYLREREGYDRRIAVLELEATERIRRITQLEKELQATKTGTNQRGRPGGRPPPTGLTQPPKPCGCDKTDPLCDCW